MNRFLIIFLAGSFSTLSAADYTPHSPTQLYESHLQRIEAKIQANKETRASIFGHLLVLNNGDRRDVIKSEAANLRSVQKENSRKHCALDLKKLKKDLKKLLREKERIKSTQGGD
jgi:hypothetical protein